MTKGLDLRTIKLLQAEGWPTVEKVEWWNAHSRRKHDLFGIFDVLAVGPRGTLAVQVTSATNVAARIRKIADSEHVGSVREAGWAIEVHGWRKNKSNRWELHRREDIS